MASIENSIRKGLSASVEMSSILSRYPNLHARAIEVRLFNGRRLKTQF